jgi:hypothetical protein
MDPGPVPLLLRCLFLRLQDLLSLRRSNNASHFLVPVPVPIADAYENRAARPHLRGVRMRPAAPLPGFRLSWYCRTGAIFLRLSPVACGESAGSPTSAPERFLPLATSALTAAAVSALSTTAGMPACADDAAVVVEEDGWNGIVCASRKMYDGPDVVGVGAVGVPGVESLGRLDGVLGADRGGFT